MKKLPFNNFKLLWLLMPLLAVFVLITSCGDDDDDPPVPTENPIASFQFAIDQTNFLQVAFTNFSQNATSYDWDFGDGNSSADENPVHTYAGGGTYTVVLTAFNDAGASAQRSETITITDPNSELSLLAGQTSKTWYLQREGIALGIGPAPNDNVWWSFGDADVGGVTPLKDRPCILDDSFTFHRDGTFEQNTAGTIFVDSDGTGDAANNGGWHPEEGCWDESDPNVWGDNQDRSAFANGGDYTYELDNANRTLTINGLGAYIGLPNKTEAGDNNLPVQSKTYEVFTLAEGDIADTLGIALVGPTWNFYLVSYHDPADLPDIPTEAPPFGEDLPDNSPTELSNSFDGNFVLLDTIVPSGSTIDYGVDDPADASAPKVGQFNRTSEQYQELKFQTSPDKWDINFENLTTVSLDVYLPSSNDYSGGLNDNVIIGLADQSATQQWWTDHYEFLTEGVAKDEWVTLSFSLDANNSGFGEGTIYERNDLDMIYINIGGGDHNVTATFYVRNFKFE